MQRIAIFAAALLLAVGPAAAQHKQAPEHGQVHHGHRFDDPDKWSKSFDNPERDSWQMPAAVVKALALAPAAHIADIGAGTGYFTVRLAKAVPQGAVYAVDVESRMVEHLAKRAESLGLANVRAVRGSETAANLPGPVDVALFVNSFHHIADRVGYMRGLAASLKPAGRIALIEYRPDAKRGAPKHMRLTVARIDSDMKSAGFRRVASHDFLPHQSFLVYQASVQRAPTP